MKVDRSVIIRLKAKDEQAFEIVFKQYVNLVYHVIYLIVKDKDDSDDLTQDTLIQMMKSIENFDEKNNFKYWLLTIAKNKAYDFLKKRRPLVNGEYIIHTFSNGITQQDEKADFDDMMSQYQHIITIEEFDIITLHLFHGLRFKEIAKIYEKTVSSVNNIYHRGISKIRKNWR